MGPIWLRGFALGLLLALVLLIGGCGEDSSSTTQGASSQPQSQTPSAKAPSDEYKGGEASIEEFGAEAEGSEREAILAVFTGYLKALADKDYESACADLAAIVHEGLAQLAGKGAKADCATALPKLLSPSAPAVARQQANGQIAKVRFEGDRAFVVFKAPGAKLYQQNMVSEDGEWRLATMATSVLVPEL